MGIEKVGSALGYLLSPNKGEAAYRDRMTENDRRSSVASDAEIKRIKANAMQYEGIANAARESGIPENQISQYVLAVQGGYGSGVKNMASAASIRQITNARQLMQDMGDTFDPTSPNVQALVAGSGEPLLKNTDIKNGNIFNPYGQPTQPIGLTALGQQLVGESVARRNATTIRANAAAGASNAAAGASRARAGSYAEKPAPAAAAAPVAPAAAPIMVAVGSAEEARKVWRTLKKGDGIQFPNGATKVKE